MTPSAQRRVAELIRDLNLAPHPEGGYFTQIFRSTSLVVPGDGRGPRPYVTTIYFLLPGDACSRWHRVLSDEVWHFYEGEPLELLRLSADLTTLTSARLGPLAVDQAPVHTVSAGEWQAARTTGSYTLVGCTVGPGFDFQDFTMMSECPEHAARVRAAWPGAADLI